MGSTLRALLVDFYGTLVRDDDVVVGGICNNVAAGLGRPGWDSLPTSSKRRVATAPRDQLAVEFCIESPLRHMK